MTDPDDTTATILHCHACGEDQLMYLFDNDECVKCRKTMIEHLWWFYSVKGHDPLQYRIRIPARSEE